MSFLKPVKSLCSARCVGWRIKIYFLITICLILLCLLETQTSKETFSSSVLTLVNRFKCHSRLNQSGDFVEKEESNKSNKGNKNKTLMDKTVVLENAAKFVLINTYMRSGSTILASLLGHHDNAFYFSEPLQFVLSYSYINGSKVCEYTRPECHDGTVVKEFCLNYISDIFNCKLRQHANIYNPSVNFRGNSEGPKWKAFHDCISKNQSNEDACLNVMEKVCENATVRVIKILRLSLMDTAYFLEKYTNLYVFQLFRDPRSIINSHIFTSWHPVELRDIRRITDDVKTQCSRLRDDLKASKPLTERYPKSVRVLQYEDLFLDIWKIKTLYQLVGLDKLPNIEEFVNKTTHHRFDGSKVTKQKPLFPKYFGYRDSLPYHIVKIVQEHCADVIQQLGFKIFQTEEELRNPNISSISSRLPFEL